MRKFFIAVVILFSSIVSAQPITAKSWIVTDEHGRLIESMNSDQVRSIASITKLMTSMVVLDAHQNLNEIINGNTRADLIQLALVRSDNAAAAKLCDNYPGGKDRCVMAMNLKAAALGMTNTHYVDSTGLSVFNVSTADDLVKLVQAASAYAEIQKAAQTMEITQRVNKRVKKRKKTYVRSVVVKQAHNTNSLVKNYNFIVSKTGFINASGGCIAFMVETSIGRRIVVLLGSKNTRTRIPEAESFISKL